MTSAMWRNFWKASLVSLAAYAAAVLIGISIGLWFTLAAVPVLQAVWGLFCLIRIVQLRRAGAHRAEATEWDRGSYGFSLGGLFSSCVLFLLVVAATQVV